MKTVVYGTFFDCLIRGSELLNAWHHPRRVQCDYGQVLDDIQADLRSGACRC